MLGPLLATSIHTEPSLFAPAFKSTRPSVGMLRRHSSLDSPAPAARSQRQFPPPGRRKSGRGWTLPSRYREDGRHPQRNRGYRQGSGRLLRTAWACVRQEIGGQPFQAAGLLGCNLKHLFALGSFQLVPPRCRTEHSQLSKPDSGSREQCRWQGARRRQVFLPAATAPLPSLGPPDSQRAAPLFGASDSPKTIPARPPPYRSRKRFQSQCIRSRGSDLVPRKCQTQRKLMESTTAMTASVGSRARRNAATRMGTIMMTKYWVSSRLVIPCRTIARRILKQIEPQLSSRCPWVPGEWSGMPARIILRLEQRIPLPGWRSRGLRGNPSKRQIESGRGAGWQV